MTLPSPAIPASGVAVNNPTGQLCVVSTTGGTVQSIYSGWQSALFPPPASVTPPAIPASTVTATNPSATTAQLVAISGGTSTVVAVNGVTVATATPATVVVPPGGTIAITYTVVPTGWTWTPLAGGASGNPLTPGTLVGPVYPWGTVSLLYTVIPTSWTWLNPLTLGGVPSYALENVQVGAGSGEIPALPSTLPTTSRLMGGLAGLGVAESN